MHWEFILALVIAIPIILFPAAFVWYTNIGGIYAALKKAWHKRAALRKRVEIEGKLISNESGTRSDSAVRDTWSSKYGKFKYKNN